MIDKKLLATLVCPMDRSPLQPAGDSLLARLNRAIAAGRVRNQGGKPLERPIEGGLLRADKTLLYPIVDGIPVLLADEAVAMSQI